MSQWISPRAELFAEHFDLRYPGPEPGELEFVLRRIAEGGEPVLELGCGTGRVLAPLHEHGIDVSGIDVSAAMLERCRAKCHGCEPDLRLQSMQALELPRCFGTVFMGSCGLGVLTSEDDVRATFRSVFRHLDSGGVFSFEIETPAQSGRAASRPGVWSGGWNEAADGSALVWRMVHDPGEEPNVRPSVIIFERFVDGRLTETELHRTTMRFWPVEPVRAMLEETGFAGIIVTRVFSDDEPPGDHRWLVVRARKP